MCDGKWGVEGRLRQDCGRLKHLFQPRFFPSFLPTKNQKKRIKEGWNTFSKQLFSNQFFVHPTFFSTNFFSNQVFSDQPKSKNWEKKEDRNICSIFLSNEKVERITCSNKLILFIVAKKMCVPTKKKLAEKNLFQPSCLSFYLSFFFVCLAEIHTFLHNAYCPKKAELLVPTFVQKSWNSCSNQLLLQWGQKNKTGFNQLCPTNKTEHFQNVKKHSAQKPTWRMWRADTYQKQKLTICLMVP